METESVILFGPELPDFWQGGGEDGMNSLIMAKKNSAVYVAVERTWWFMEVL